MGALESLNPTLRQALYDAFVATLKKELLDKKIEKKYSMCAGQPDTPDLKMARYARARHIHNGSVPSIVCSCYNPNSASVPCPYDMGKPDRIGMQPKNKEEYIPASGSRVLNKLSSPVLRLLQQYDENGELYNDE